MVSISNLIDVHELTVTPDESLRVYLLDHKMNKILCYLRVDWRGTPSIQLAPEHHHIVTDHEILF